MLEAAFAMLAERGYDRLAIEQVAEAAGAGKATIYRWWKNEAELAADAFFHTTEPELRFPDTGAAREDFRAQITELAGFLRGPRGRVFAALLGGARTDRELASALSRLWLAPRQAWGRDRIGRAIAAGECRPGIDPLAALGILYGPLYTPLLFDRDVPPAGQVEAHLAIALAAIFVDPRPS